MAAVVEDSSIRNLWGFLRPLKNPPRNTTTNPTTNSSQPQPLATTPTPTSTPNHADSYLDARRIPFREDTVYVYPRAKNAISPEHRDRFPIVQEILRRNVEHDPKLLKYTAFLSYELQMCGISREDAKPSILVNCPRRPKLILKRLKALFLQAHVKEQYHTDVALVPTILYVPRFRLFFWAEEREIIWGRSDFVTIDTRGQHEPEQFSRSSGLTMCGARVMAGDFGERCSTVGCLLRVGTQYYCLTSAHTFEAWTPPQIFIEEDSDDDGDFEDDEYNLDMPYSDDTGSSPLSLRLDQVGLERGSVHAREKVSKLPGAMPKHGIISPPMDDDTWTSNHPYRDWALVQVTEPSYWRPNVYFSPSDPHVPKFFSKFASCLPKESRGVYLVSSMIPAQYGTLHPIPAYIGGHGTRTCEVWTVSLSDNQVPRKGDSGSIVLDARTKEVYGHAVAVTPLGDLYVVPLKDTLMEIKELLGTTDVDFPNNAAILIDLLILYHTTRPQSGELQNVIQAFQMMVERERNGLELEIALKKYLKSNDSTFVTTRHYSTFSGYEKSWNLNMHIQNVPSLCNSRQGLSQREPITRIKWVNNPKPYSFCRNIFPLATGSFSEVYKVEICTTHFSKPYGCSCEKPPLRVAWKTCRSNNESEQAQLDTELTVLMLLQKYSHPHIIDLLGSVQQEDGIGLVFPLAISDIDSVMSLEDHRQDPTYASWLLGQIRGIASALDLIHTSRIRHKDIKPSNILLMSNPSTERADSQYQGYGTFVLADFGLSHFKTNSKYKSVTKVGGASNAQWSLGTEQVLADRQYIAPETEIERMSFPASDIWSLGCVMLEVLVWITYGKTARKELLKELNTNSTGERDPFWMVLESSKVVLRPAVISWIERLEKSMKGDHVLFPALNIIQSGMLDPDPGRRLSAADLLERLEKSPANPGARDSSQSSNVQTNPKDDLKREDPDRPSQLNIPPAKVDLPSESTELTMTAVSSSADGIPKRCAQSDSAVDGSNLKSQYLANAKDIRSAAQEGRWSLYQDEDFAMEQKIANVVNPQGDAQGSDILELAEDLQKLCTEEKYTLSSPATRAADTVEASSTSNEAQGKDIASSSTSPKCTPRDRHLVLASIINRFADGIQATIPKQPDDDTSIISEPACSPSDTETSNSVDESQPSVPSNEQASPDPQLHGRSRSPRRSYQRSAHKEDHHKVLKRRKRSSSESGVRTGEGVVQIAKFSPTDKKKSFKGAPPRMRSGGVTHFRSGDFVADQRLLNTH